MSKRNPSTHRTPEQMKRHYKEYHGTPEQIAKRSMRNKARRTMEKEHGASALKGKDVDHKTPLRHGGGNGKGNLRLMDVSKNRGWEKKR